MPFDDSLIGSNDFDPRTATEDLIRRTSSEPLPDTLEPRMLNTRLARKLGQTPTRPTRLEQAPEKDKAPDLDFSQQALPPTGIEPSGGKNDLDFTSQVTPQVPPAPLGVTGNLGAFGKGLPTGAVEGVGGILKGGAALYDNGIPATEGMPEYDAMGQPTGRTLPPTAAVPAKPLNERTLYKAGKAVSDFHPNMTDQERDSIGGRVGTMAGGIAPYAAAALAGGPAVGIAAGFTGIAADTYGKVYEDAKAKGADDAAAQAAASKSAAAAGILGALPLGTGTLAKSIIGKVLSQGVTFASTNEATEYVLQEIAKDYDEKAGYHPEAKRIIASLITGGLLGGLHAFERKAPEQARGDEAPAGTQREGLPGPDPTMQGPDEARQRSEQQARDHQWGRGPDDQAGAGAGTGPEPGPQGGPQPGGARAKPGEGEQKPGEPPKGEGEEVPDDYALDPKMRTKLERVYRSFNKGADPSKMTDAELFRSVNESLRDTSSTGYTAKPETAQERTARQEAETDRYERDTLIKRGWDPAWVRAMTPEQRSKAYQTSRSRTSPGEGSEQTKDARNAEARGASPAGVRGVAGDQATLHQSEGPGIQELRGARDHDRPDVGGGLSGVPDRDRPQAGTASDAGADQERSGLRSGQREVGNPARAGEQPSQEPQFDGERPHANAGDVGAGNRNEPGLTLDSNLSARDVSGRGGTDAEAGARESPIVARTADDVLAAQPTEPKSHAQAEAENFRHSHLEVPHLGLKGENSISIETGVGQTRKGPPGPDGEPEWEVKMEHGAYGRIKGTKGADGQPLDIMVGPHPSSPHVFILNQHDPKTGQFDELKVQAGYRTPIDAMHAYANSFDDGAQGRIGGVVAMTADQFRAWLKHGDHTKEVQHGDAKAVLARAFGSGITNVKAGSGGNGGVESIASSPGLLNAGEEARRPLTEAPTEAAVAGVPKGSQGRDANEASPRPAGKTTQDLGRSKAADKISLLEFLADRGGLKPHPELEAIGFGGMHRVQIPGRKGFFGLIKSDGWDLDTAREAAEEAGYLHGDSDNVTSTIRHLLDAMDTEVRGQKLYPYQGEGERTKTEKRLDDEREAHERARAQELIDELDEAGHGEMGPELKAKTLQFMAQGMDADTAVDHAMAALNAEEATQSEIDAIYGDGAYDEVHAGIPYEGGPLDGSEGGEGDGRETGPPDVVGEHEPEAGSADSEAGDGRREGGEATEAAGRDETTGEGGPVREPASTIERTAGRKQTARDEARDTARQEPAAGNPDDAKGGIEHGGKIAAASEHIDDFIKSVEANIAAGHMDADLAPTKSMGEFRAIAEQRGWTYSAYGKGKALWSPDRKHVMFPSVAVEGNTLQVQWATPGEGITPPGGTEPSPVAKPKKAKSVDDLTAAEKKAHRDAPTWAQVLADLPMHKDGRTHEFEIAFDIIKEITGKKKAPKFDDLTPEQKGEIYERVRALKPQPVVPDYARYFVDNPGGEWLSNKQEDALADGRRKQTKGATTAALQSKSDKTRVALPTDLLAKVPGMNDEQRRPGDEQYDDLLAAVKKVGWNNDSPILVMVNHLGKPYIAEGNTRVAVAKAIGQSTVPVEVQWRNGAEQVAGPWNPASILPQVTKAAVPTTETGADNKQQTVIPGAEKAADKTMAQRGADAPLKPKANQKPADDGLFGDGHKQTDLLDMVAKPSRKVGITRDTAGYHIIDETTRENLAGPYEAQKDANAARAAVMAGLAPAKPTAPPKDELDDALDQAINEHRAKPMSMDEVAKGLGAIFGKKPLGLSDATESLNEFSEETYAQALPYFKAGMSQVANAGDLLSMARALVSQLAGAGMDVETITAMKPYMRRFMDDVRSGKETINAPSRGEVLERDRANADAQDGVGAADVPAAAGATGRGAGARGKPADAGDQRPASGERLPQDYAPVVGERGNLEIPEREPVVDDSDATAPESERSADGGEEGFQFDQRADGEAEEAAQRDADINARRKAQAEADAKHIPIKPGDLDNIAQTLPMLFPEQHADVKAAEDRFAKADGHGMLFTNGTGTGKTYSGLGIIKRFALAGKKQAIVIAPSQGILMDWQKVARTMGLDAHILNSTVDKGRPGLNLTTYANFGDNAHIVDHEWDLIVPDEAHKLSSDQDGTTTQALRTLRALTYHPDGLMRRAEMVLRDLYGKIIPLREKPTAQETAAHTAAVQAYNAKAEPLIKKWQDYPRPNKAAFLSATPFAYHFSLDWARGYLFDFPEDINPGSYHGQTGRDQFYIQHLGYRKRVGKLTKPDAEVKQEVMERQLHEYLKKTGSLAGRMLTVDKDYDRKFILAHEAIGADIDRALNFLQENEEFRPLLDYVSKRFDYLTRMRLLEAIKARAAVPYIKESMALGRKVVVFHDYNEGGGINPFELSFSDDAKTSRYKDGKHEEVSLKPLYEDFIRQNPYVRELKFASYGPPLQTLTAAFPKALTYNGTVSKKKRDAAKTLFNDDNSGHDLIIVQSAAGEAGISLHDTTGKHQRVTLNLGMPIRPVSSIQQEGRIYRVGQASDALFRYMNTGTDWERWTFAGKIADRAGTAENLALGDQARTIRQAFIDAFANADDNRPEAGEGTGGKAADRAVTHSMSEFEKAKTHYFAQAKVKGRRDQREGTDYYATPEPLGLKMVEWANVKSGEKILEPSAGHGAIARYFPEDTHRTLVEPSSSLASRAALNSAGARVVADRFENLDTGANKFDAIVMNPPFGVGGKTAMDHIEKAAKHLKNGGRIVALIPRGEQMTKRLNAFLNGEGAGKHLFIRGSAHLPPVAFERAGTSISTQIIVLEKQTDAAVAKRFDDDAPAASMKDYSREETVGELFDRIEHAEMPERLEPKTKDVDAPVNGNITVGGVELHLWGGTDNTSKKFFSDIKNKLGRDVFAKTAKTAEAAGGRYSRALKSFEFDTAEARQKFLDTLANPPKEAEAPTAPSGVTFKNGETIHAKTGAKLYVASPTQRVERDVYDQMNAAAKAAGGYYSSFNKNGAVPGFQFPSEAARAKFLEKMGGNGGLSEGEAPFAKAPLGAQGQSYVLEQGRRTKTEYLTVYDANGEVGRGGDGRADFVSWPKAVEDRLFDPSADMVAHHNHPSNQGFSPLDVAMLGLPGLRAVYAHGHGGAVYRGELTSSYKQALPPNMALVPLVTALWGRIETRLKPIVQQGIYDRQVAVDEANQVLNHLVSRVMADAGLMHYDTNLDIGSFVDQIPTLHAEMEKAANVARREAFGGSRARTNDRRTGGVQHPGDMGVVFDRAALAKPVGDSRPIDRADREDRRREAPVVDRGVGGDQPRLLDAPPGLEDLDQTFNDLLGRRLLGRLGDLNATEMRVQLQDKFARVKNVEQDKGNTNTALSAYQAESLYYGRTGQRLETLKEHVVDPIIREMKGRSIDLDTMDKFLYARHAPERNNVTGRLYPAGHEFNRATIDPTVKGASGMSSSEANSFIGRLRAAGKLADYEAVGRMVDALNFRTRQTLLSGGLIDRATFDALNSQYRYYVPLRGWQEGSDEASLPHQGRGMDTRAKSFKQAFGRKSLAASPLAYSIMQAEQAIVRAEKNKVGNTFVRFARANPDPDLWTINQPTPRKMISKATGMVHNTPTWDMNKDNVFVTRIDGKATLVEFKGEDGGNLARALKNMGTANVHSAIRMMAAVTHTMAKLVTSWNPDFMIPNLVRDVGEAFINLGEQRQRDFVWKFWKRILPSIAGASMAIAGKTPEPGSMFHPYVEAFHEFDREGGRVRFFGIDAPDQIEQNVEKRLKRLSGGVVNSVKDLGEKAGKAMEIMGGGIENATRLAAYMTAREFGMSAPISAMLARNLTVNFNKNGELGSAISSLYMFANAGVQGQARMLQAMHPRNRKVWLAIGALTAASVGSTAFNLGIGGYDSAGKADYMKIPSWERDKNIIVMGPGGTYGKIPLPYGFSPFAVLGSHMTTVLMGQEKPTTAAAAVLSSIASAFNPVGEEGSLIAELVPTALRPALHITYNENWNGRPIYPARDSDKGKPNSQQSFRTDTAASKAVAEGLNSATGGDRYRPGAIDLHPGSLDHVMGAITGGVGKFAKNVAETLWNGWSGKEWEASKTPILRRFVGKIDHNMADRDAYYEVRKEVTEEAHRTTQARKDLKTGINEQEAQAYLDATPAGRQKIIFDRADKRMGMLRAQEDRINSSAQPYDAKKAALDALRKQMRDVQNEARAESSKMKREQEQEQQKSRLYVGPNRGKQ